ncbi:MAG: 1-acyl-sn-glycerol-3-phosphate [Geobacteraceae bacterium]|nr:MAG: 1-acyl-sn-glycerol-3-phosphate [Geobacteraceae bacterium]
MLRAYLFLLIFIPLTFLLAASAIIFTLIDPTGRIYHRHAKIWSWVSLRLAGVKVEVAGRERIPAGEPVIFMSNHQGNFDILSLYIAIPRQFAWLAKEELFKIAVFGHSMGRAGYIPLDRSDGRSALKSIDAAAAKIKSGHSVVVFPEGTRTKDGTLLPFRRGGFLLAAKAGVPIVPVTINGSISINPKNRIELYPGVIRIRFADPIPATGTSGKQRDLLMEQVKTAIEAGLES